MAPAAEADPPGRVATLSYRDGGVVFAPEGEEEWVDLPQNRPLTVGDRVWSDRNARAEVHLGTAILHLDGESHVGISALDDQAAQFILMQGSVNARVRELAAGENFEIDTPNLALRATQAGEYRIDVGPEGKETRVVVLSGMVTVYGEGGESLNLGAGQQASFAGRYLAQVNGPVWRADEFAQWAAARNQAEDQSIAARHVPRGVVGYAQLDQHGTWSQDANYGTVWYPQVPTADWAPYRDGRWEWVQPWGWTWVDAAPWGFAPFHYGRWAQIGPRWAWVPGQLAARPLYSPALVAFMGGAVVANGPGVGWYPLAPGEAWWPTYRTSSRYVSYVNYRIDLNRYPRTYAHHWFRDRPYAVTTVRVDDFRHGRGVRDTWRPATSQWTGQARLGMVPQRPDRRQDRPMTTPRLFAAPPSATQSNWANRQWSQRGEGAVQRPRESARVDQRFDRRDDRQDGRQDGRRDNNQSIRPVQPPQDRQAFDRDRGVREQQRAQHEQQRLQRDAERTAREQQQQQTQQQQQWRQQRNDLARQQQEQARQQDVQRQQHAQQMQQNQIRAQQEQARHQQEQVMRQQHDQQRVQRETWAREREERVRAHQLPQQVMQPQVQQQQAVPIGRQAAPRGDDERGRRNDAREGRGDRGGEGRGQQRGDDDGQGRGGRHGGWQRNG